MTSEVEAKLLALGPENPPEVQEELGLLYDAAVAARWLPARDTSRPLRDK